MSWLGFGMDKVMPCQSLDTDREWTRRALALLEAEGRRSADTHLINLPVAGLPGVDLYFKDESAHPTGSLKHRLARSLFIYGICNGKITPGVTLIEASSGSTAVSEAYYARLLGLRFVAVLPSSTSRRKIEAIELQGGHCHLVEDGRTIHGEAERLARDCGGHYLDQFTYAERATDWRSNNIADAIYRQMVDEQHPVPNWIVASAGTGGTSATIGRHIRYRGYSTQLLVPDVEYSAFYEGWRDGNPRARCETPTRIEGIGRPQVEKSFVPEVVDAMIKVPDAASLAAMRVLSRRLGRRVGGSTGTNFYGMCWAASQMRNKNEPGSIVTLICDSGERYADTYYCDDWLADRQIHTAPIEAMIEDFLEGARLAPSAIRQDRRLAAFMF